MHTCNMELVRARLIDFAQLAYFRSMQCASWLWESTRPDANVLGDDHLAQRFRVINCSAQWIQLNFSYMRWILYESSCQQVPRFGTPFLPLRVTPAHPWSSSHHLANVSTINLVLIYSSIFHLSKMVDILSLPWRRIYSNLLLSNPIWIHSSYLNLA